MNIVVTGSIAFDYLMSFPGKFTEHFLPEHMSRVSLSFLVDTMDKRRGGCAPNIAYTLALLGERPRLMATAGQDFGDYRRWLEAAGVDTSLVERGGGQVHRVVLLQHRLGEQPDRVVLHRRDGQRRRAVVPHASTTARLAIISPNDPGAMVQYAEECRTLGIPLHLGSGPAVRADVGRRAARTGWSAPRIVICNDYEFELIRQKTGLDEADDPRRRPAALVVTRGEHGCSVSRPAAAGPTSRRCRRQRIVDPTGVGDAFRGGFLKGMARGRRRGDVGAAGQRRGRLCARAPRRSEPRLHLAGVQGSLRRTLLGAQPVLE